MPDAAPQLTPERVATAFQEAWNAHDMEAFAALFDENSTFVNRFGHFVRGVDEIVDLHEPIHRTIYRDSIMENELLDIRRLGQEVAVIHFWSRLTVGSAHPAGPHSVDTLILSVLQRQEHGWRIQALENVTLTDPRSGEPQLRERHPRGS